MSTWRSTTSTQYFLFKPAQIRLTHMFSIHQFAVHADTKFMDTCSLVLQVANNLFKVFSLKITYDNLDISSAK